jgi:hypothetical protein
MDVKRCTLLLAGFVPAGQRWTPALHRSVRAVCEEAGLTDAAAEAVARAASTGAAPQVPSYAQLQLHAIRPCRAPRLATASLCPATQPRPPMPPSLPKLTPSFPDSLFPATAQNPGVLLSKLLAVSEALGPRLGGRRALMSLLRGAPSLLRLAPSSLEWNLTALEGMLPSAVLPRCV